CAEARRRPGIAGAGRGRSSGRPARYSRRALGRRNHHGQADQGPDRQRCAEARRRPGIAGAGRGRSSGRPARYSRRALGR
ncbi:hypothetical protein C7E17_25835, partial [Stenotrophomonas maltophilia]